MWKNKGFSFLTVIILLLGYSSLFAQGTGRITGVVTDSLTNQTMAGVNVGLLGTSLGAATDLNGKYTIGPVPAGTYTLIASYVGYNTFKTKVTIARGKEVKLNIKLKQVTVQGQAVVVSVQAEGQRQAINQQLQSDKIVNVVSQAKIQSLPDFNAAASLGRLPGVSTQKSSGEANKVVIRGLAPKYNSIEVDGIKLSSTGSDQIGVSSLENTSGNLNNDRSVDLTMVSPYMIRTIAVYKALTPDMNANSIGGTVNMELREAPKKPHWSVMWQQGYTQKNKYYGNYRVVASGSRRFFHNKLGVYALANAESYDRYADNMNANYGVFSSVVNPETGFQPVKVRGVTLNRHLENRKRYGANLILDYKLPKGSIKAVNMYARLNSDFSDYNQGFDYVNGNMNWSLQHGTHQIDQQVNSLKLDYDFGFISTKLSASYTQAKNTLSNSPHFSFHQTSGVPSGTAVPVDVKPDSIANQGISYYGDQSNGQTLDELENVSLFNSNYKDGNFEYKADFKVPFNFGTSAGGFLKFGGQYDRRKVTNDQSTPYAAINGASTTSNNIQAVLMRDLSSKFNLTANSNGLFPMSEFVSTKQSLYNSFLNNRFGDFYYAPDAVLLNNMVDFLRTDSTINAVHSSAVNPGGWFDGPYQKLANDYTYHDNYYAAYIMSRIDFHDIMAVGGVRLEKVTSDYSAYNARDNRNPQTQMMYKTTSHTRNQFFLPMVQVKYSPFQWMDVRYAYTQTLARPDFSQLSPKFTVTQSNNVYAGNPSLTPARAYNQDVDLTFHANKLGLLSIGAYYKKIEGFTFNATYLLNNGTQQAGFDSLSNYQVVQNGNVVVSPDPSKKIFIHRPINNSHPATIKGLEIDFQTNLWYLPHPLDGIVLGINYSLIRSKTEYPLFTQRVIPGTRPPQYAFIDSSRTGRLIDQPDNIMNAYVGYDYLGFSGRLSFTYQGNSVSYIGDFPVTDGFVRNYFRIDFSARQKLPWMGGELFLNISNLNGEKNVAAQRSIGGSTSVQSYGMTANLGIRIRY